MSELLHENSKGIKIVREDYKNRSQVKVLFEGQGKRCLIGSYRFNRVADIFDSPYCSWANLDCCGGWNYDEAYLDTAVQNGKKLYAGRTQTLKGPYYPNNPTKKEALQRFQEFSKTLPANVFADIEEIFDTEEYLHTFICRKGTISDFFNLDYVFEFYKALGVELSTSIKQTVRDLCKKEIKSFGGSTPPYIYFNATTQAELITTGLLLGYPIESTASIICG